MAMPHAGCSQGRHLNINHITTMIDASNAVPQPHPTSKQFHDLTGRVFGRLTVLFYAGANNGSFWACRCECGKDVVRPAYNLKSGAVRSCGCLNMECLKARALHGMARKGAVVPEMGVWENIRTRCHNQKCRAFKDYGGRGILMCDRWLVGENGETGFACFYADMGPRPTRKHQIDRIDNNKGYSPDNCRWTDIKTNARNKRNTLWVPHNGKMISLAEVADLSGIPYSALLYRVNVGWPMHLLTQPSRGKRCKATSQPASPPCP